MGCSVFDASVVVKLVVHEPGSDHARIAFTQASAPLLLDWTSLEVAHALWKRTMRNQAQSTEATTALESLSRLAFAEFAAAPLLESALEIALRSRHAVYDCLYVALALVEDAALVTADAKQREVAEVAGVEVLWIDSMPG